MEPDASDSRLPRWLSGKESTCQSLSWEDPLEEEMVTHSTILAWEMPWTEEPGGLQSMGRQKSHTQLSTYILPLWSTPTIQIISNV